MPDLIIDKPGLYGDIPEAEYHRDPVVGGSLSVTASKLLLPPSVPAKFKYAREHPHQSSKAMDDGTRVHALVLGKGEEQIEQLNFPNYTTDKAKAAKKAAIAAGKVPTLPHEMAEAQAIADAVKAHPTAGGLFADGDAEQSLFWQDDDFKVPRGGERAGIWLRARMDWLTLQWAMPTIVDFKTSADASPEGFAKSVASFGYHRQDPHYRDGLAAHLRCDPDEIDFVFVVAETEPPYLVATYRIVEAHADLGREQNRIAREIYADCTASGIWPGYSEEIEDMELRYYDAQRIKKEISDWHD